MSFKQDNPGCNCCRPCCAQVWDYLRDEYSTGTFKFTGNDPAILSPSPYIESGNFVESISFGSIVFYQCLYGSSASEVVLDNEFYYSSGDPRLIGFAVGVDPGSGDTFYEYGGGGISITVPTCDPPTIQITQYCRYSIYISSSPAGSLTSAGYVLDPTYGFGDRYTKTSGDIFHTVTQRGSGSNYWDLNSTYQKSVSGESNLMSGFPSVITVAPAWNPMGKSSEFTFS